MSVLHRCLYFDILECQSNPSPYGLNVLRQQR